MQRFLVSAFLLLSITGFSQPQQLEDSMLAKYSPAGSAFDFSLYPNPAHNIVYVRLPEAQPEPAVVVFTDTLGTVLKQDTYQLLPKSFSFTFPDDLPQGKYFLHIQCPSKHATSKVTICTY